MRRLVAKGNEILAPNALPHSLRIMCALKKRSSDALALLGKSGHLVRVSRRQVASRKWSGDPSCRQSHGAGLRAPPHPFICATPEHHGLLASPIPFAKSSTACRRFSGIERYALSNSRASMLSKTSMKSLRVLASDEQQ